MSTTTQPEIVTNPETEATHYGIRVVSLGEDGDMLALGHPGIRRAFAAFNRHARFLGFDNLADDRDALLSDWITAVEEKWVTFRRPDPEQGEDPDYVWFIDDAAKGAPGAQPVTILNA